MRKRKQIEELEFGINGAAEGAVQMARRLLIKAVKAMSVGDAKKILAGDDPSFAQFFADRTRSPLSVQFLPVVQKVTAKIGLAQQYDSLAGKAAGLGLVKKEDARIDQYVTRKALDGLYLVIGEQGCKPRQDPVSAGSDILRKVFGVLR